uniref:Transcription factor TFIIB cyclin-like domain-containing protein n=1 Tax=viral metagenome TaxID=1070528 RepID=A0A6C0HRV7_9ZZZZ
MSFRKKYINDMWKTFDEEIEEEVEKRKEVQDKNKDYCDKCESILFISDEGFNVCSGISCGIIYKDSVDQSAEWRYYGADDSHSSDPTRCGMPINPLLAESSFGCKVISLGSNKISYEMRKIKRYTEWQSMPYKEKAQYDEFQKISMFAQNAGIPKIIIDDAILYHKKISQYEQTFRGENKDGLLLAAVYISCRQNKYPRTAKELSIIFGVDITCATKGCKTAQVILNDLEKDLTMNEKTTFNKTTPDSFIQRYCSKLSINAELTRLCEFVSVKIEKQNLMPENTPHSIAAGVIYFIVQLCQLDISKKDIRNVSEISEVTINKCYKKMEKLKETLIPSIILKKYPN